MAVSTTSLAARRRVVDTGIRRHDGVATAVLRITVLVNQPE
jgi:hypothetical protein